MPAEQQQHVGKCQAADQEVDLSAACRQVNGVAVDNSLNRLWPKAIVAVRRRQNDVFISQERQAVPKQIDVFNGAANETGVGRRRGIACHPGRPVKLSECKCAVVFSDQHMRHSLRIKLVNDAGRYGFLPYAFTKATACIGDKLDVVIVSLSGGATLNLDNKTVFSFYGQV